MAEQSNAQEQNDQADNQDIHMGEAGLLRKLIRLKKLEGVFLFVTSKCNSKCRTCFYHDKINSKDDMTFEEIEKISKSAPRFDKLWLSGGEPFMRKDLVEIIKLFYDNNHVRVINLPTNGMLKDNIESMTARLLNVCPELSVHLNFSLDGLGKTHDANRGVPGNFLKTIDTMATMRGIYRDHPRLLINAVSVITPENCDQLFDLGVYLLKKDLVATHVFEVVRGDPRDPETKRITPEQLSSLRKSVFPLFEKQADNLFKDFKGTKKAFAKMYFLGFLGFVNGIQDENFVAPTHWGMSCTAGKTTFVIDHDGAFRSCEMRPPIGNLRDYDFNLTAALYSKAMNDEIHAVGGGKRADCWCTHGCWIMSSMKFSPRALLFRIPAAYRRNKKNRIENFELPAIDIQAIEQYDVQSKRKIG
jgi:MoaA/NifB/PqqE/SkfB family radical SAM enzyme